MQGKELSDIQDWNHGTDDVFRILRLEKQQDSLIGHPPDHAANNNDVVWGGVVMGQAVAAASRGLNRPLHMMSARFRHGASVSHILEYVIADSHDGGSFSSRQVNALQNGRKLAEFSMSFQKDEAGQDYQASWVEPPPADSLETLASATAGIESLPSSTRRSLSRTRGLDIRPVDPEAIIVPKTGRPIRFWIRVAYALDAKPELWAPAIAYLTDFLMAGGGVVRHTFLHDPAYFGVTLNHTLWLHKLVNPSNWLLHEVESHWTGGGRTLSMGRIYTAEGRLIATTAQEALLRKRKPRNKEDAR